MRRLSEEHKLKISKSNKGKVISQKTRDKIRDSRLRGFKEGTINPPWNKGKKNCYSEETLKKMRKSSSGKKVSNSTKKKISKSLKCRKFSAEHRKKLSMAGKNRIITKIHREKIKETFIRKGISFGKNNPNWRGGISKEPYDINWNNRFKINIRRRDNYLCMLCGIHQEKLNYALNVHHVNYNKKLSVPQNCVSLCRNCHTPTNYNRFHWVRLFQGVLSEKYGYKYNNAEIMLELI